MAESHINPVAYRLIDRATEFAFPFVSTNHINGTTFLTAFENCLNSNQILVDNIVVEVARKNIKSIRLSVHPPDGEVRISAPRRMPIATIRSFVSSKLEWIYRHQQKIRERVVAPPVSYIDGETHMLWGTPYKLQVIERNNAPAVVTVEDLLIMGVRPGADAVKREAVLANWYRIQVGAAIPLMFKKWEELLGVHAKEISIRKMKTRWGSCSTKRKTIRLSSELAKKPLECLEYVVLHELVHLIEPSHNHRFTGLMDRWMPEWREYRKVLNKQSNMLEI